MPGSWNPIWVTHIGAVAPVLELSLLSQAGKSLPTAGSWIKEEALGLKPELIWDAGVTSFS